jgi:hypothetical protein
MKKFILILLLSLFSVFNNAHSQLYMDISSSNYNQWWQTNDGGYGISSFHIQVNTDYTMKVDGYYYYNIFFFNNSHYNNGTSSSTYIKDLNFYIWNGHTWQNVLYLNYALVKPPCDGYNGVYHAAYIYAPYPVQSIKITWESHTVY